MRFDLVILDFDGTFTDVEKEAGPFFSAYRAAAREIVGEGFDDAWDRAAARVAADPAHFGWKYDGRVVAPGNADPYLRATVICAALMDELGLHTDSEKRAAILQDLYFSNYPKADTVFRPEARSIVESLLRSSANLFVVTNSATEDVERKLDVLAPEGREQLQVHGDAKKYVVTEEGGAGHAPFEKIAEEERIEGLRRPVLLRRGLYYSKLVELWEKTGATPDRTIVVGDIYELDLALPAQLGAHVHLVLKEHTPEFERTAVRQLGERGGISDGLAALRERLPLTD